MTTGHRSYELIASFCADLLRPPNVDFALNPVRACLDNQYQKSDRYSTPSWLLAMQDESMLDQSAHAIMTKRVDDAGLASWVVQCGRAHSPPFRRMVSIAAFRN